MARKRRKTPAIGTIGPSTKALGFTAETAPIPGKSCRCQGCLNLTEAVLAKLITRESLASAMTGVEQLQSAWNRLILPPSSVSPSAHLSDHDDWYGMPKSPIVLVPAGSVHAMCAGDYLMPRGVNLRPPQGLVAVWNKRISFAALRDRLTNVAVSFLPEQAQYTLPLSAYAILLYEYGCWSNTAAHLAAALCSSYDSPGDTVYGLTRHAYCRIFGLTVHKELQSHDESLFSWASGEGLRWLCTSTSERRRPKGPRSMHTYGRPDLIRSVPSKGRLVGVEWEYNGPTNQQIRRANEYDGSALIAPVKEWASRWNGQEVTDGSCGREAITPPLTGEKLKSCLTDLAAVLAPFSVDARCGIHVHVDARDLAWSDILRLMRVWAKIEPIMYAVAGQGRVSNKYCQPAADVIRQCLSAEKPKIATHAYFRLGLQSVAGASAHNEQGQVIRGYAAVTQSLHYKRDGLDKKATGRYRAMNLCPWLVRRQRPILPNTGETPRTGQEARAYMPKDCTVEFRLHRNTKDPERVYQWAMLLSNLVQWVSTHTDRDVDNLPASPLRALVAMVPSHRNWILGRLRIWRRATTVSREPVFSEASEHPIPRRAFAPKGKEWVNTCAA